MILKHNFKIMEKKLDEVDIERARLVEIIKQKYIVKELKKNETPRLKTKKNEKYYIN
jgi:hypothetical protein